jgi:hypothetical protein
MGHGWRANQQERKLKGRVTDETVPNFRITVASAGRRLRRSSCAEQHKTEHE